MVATRANCYHPEDYGRQSFSLKPLRRKGGPSAAGGEDLLASKSRTKEHEVPHEPVTTRSRNSSLCLLLSGSLLIVFVAIGAAFVLNQHELHHHYHHHPDWLEVYKQWLKKKENELLLYWKEHNMTPAEVRVFHRTGSSFIKEPQAQLAQYCPDEPSSPAAVPVFDILNNWSPARTKVAPQHYGQTVCRFNYGTEQDKALRYRQAGIPFVLYNVTEVDALVSMWARPHHLEHTLGKQQVYQVDVSRNNHFVKFESAIPPPAEEARTWTPPTTGVRMTYHEWLRHAKERNVTHKDYHYHLRVRDAHNYDLYDELASVFGPKASPVLLEKAIPSPRGKSPRELEQKRNAITCSFDQPGSIMEAHFDGAGANAVAVLKGMQRWILAHPRECAHAYLRPQPHPSERSSLVDLTKIDLKKFPEVEKLLAHEVVLMEGEVLSIPAYYINYVVSLTLSHQCTAHSESSSSIQQEEMQHLEACGFLNDDAVKDPDYVNRILKKKRAKLHQTRRVEQEEENEEQEEEEEEDDEELDGGREEVVKDEDEDEKVALAADDVLSQPTIGEGDYARFNTKKKVDAVSGLKKSKTTTTASSSKKNMKKSTKTKNAKKST